MKAKILMTFGTALFSVAAFASQSTTTPGVTRYRVVCSEMHRTAEAVGGIGGRTQLQTLKDAEYIEDQIEGIRRAGNEILDVSAPSVAAAAAAGSMVSGGQSSSSIVRRESPLFLTTYCVTVKYRRR